MNDIAISHEHTLDYRARFPGSVIDHCIGPVRIIVLGKRFGGMLRNWSFLPLQQPGDETKPECEHLVQVLSALALQLGIVRFWVPSPIDFNGEVVGPVAFPDDVQIPLPSGAIVSRGVRADGVLMPAIRGQGFGLSSSGCLTLTLWREDRPGSVVVCHGGLRSFLRWRSDDMEGWRQSVVKAAFDKLSLTEATAKYCRGAITAPIDPSIYAHPLDDPNPEYRENNRKLIGYMRQNHPSALVGDPRCGCVNLPEIPVQQLKQLGVSREHIEVGPHTGMFSGKLSDTRSDPQHKHFRNLVIVTPR